MVRNATINDVPHIVSLIEEYSINLVLDCAQTSLSKRRAANIVNQAIGLGLCQVAVSPEGEVVGASVGTVGFNVWSDITQEINLLVLYVKPDYRKGSYGARLYSSYIESANELMGKTPQILVSNVFAQPEGTNINYEKRGFKLSQISYTKEK